MVAFVIFWASLFCVIFFLLGTLFKGLASLFTGFVTSVMNVIRIAILAGLGIVALFALYLIASGIRTSGLGDVIGTIVIFVIVLGIIGGLLGGLGADLLDLATAVVEFVIAIVSGVLEGAAGICERAYVHFLMAIIKRLDKC